VTRVVFVTGTDTGVGKTLVTAALLRAARQAGVRAIGLKPVAAGGFQREVDAGDGGWVNEDALWLQAESGVVLDYRAVNPFMLPEPMSPHLAAARVGRQVAVAPVVAAVRAVVATHRPQLALVEGAGGWLCPLNDDETLADVAAALPAEVLLVVGLRLGCLNHALLTAAAITAAGLKLTGWVANTLAADMPVRVENIATLAGKLPAPLLGIVPALVDPRDLVTAAAGLAGHKLWAAAP
jgi:dethiobiotin synthetase